MAEHPETELDATGGTGLVSPSEDPARVSKRDRRALLVGAVVFALGAVEAYQTGNNLIAVANVAMAFFNLLALRMLHRAPDIVQLALFLLNAATALLMVYSTHQAGKRWLPYAWALAALTFVVGGWLKHGRRIMKGKDAHRARPAGAGGGPSND